MTKANTLLRATLISLVVLAVFYIPAIDALTDTPYDTKKEVNEKEVLELLNKKISESVVLEEGRNTEAYIEPEIYETLEEHGEAMVIVWLKRDLDPDQGSYDVDDFKERVRENQDAVLTALKKTEEKTEESADGDAVNEEESLTKENFRLVYRYEVSNGFAGIITKQGLEILSNHELVKSVYGEKILHTALAESVPLINANRVWAMQVNARNVTGTGQTICVVDTGVDYTHQALGGCFGSGCRVKGGWDFIHNDNDPRDDQGHGTHVAGIAAANSNNIKGVAPDATLIAVKVCDNSGYAGSCPGSAMIAGVDYCVSNINALGTDIITMSLGDGGEYGPTSGTCPTWMNPSLETASRMGIPITVSSGNEVHNNGIAYPSCNQNVISVGATYDAYVGSISWPQYGCSDANARVDDVTCFSNTGINLDVVAPGAMITSTHLNGNYGNNWGGTSMAAPHVAGTLALLKQIIPSLTPFQLESVLKQTGVPVTDPQNGLTFRRIDALRTVNYLTQGNDMRLTSNRASSFYPSLGTDMQGNIHIAWDDTRDGNREIYYTKLDNNGVTLVDDTRLTYHINISSMPSLGVDAQGNIHIAWEDTRDGNYEIYYTKLDNNGVTLVDDTRLTYNVSFSYNLSFSYRPSLGVDAQGNIHIAWEDFRDWNFEIYYTKLDNNGVTLVDDTRLTYHIINFFSLLPSLGVDAQGNIHIVWNDTRDWNSEIYYTKLDNHGVTLVDDTRLTHHISSSSLRPSLGVGAQGNIHIAWTDSRDGNYEIYYKHLFHYTLPSLTLAGTPAPGSTVNLQLNSPLNANQNYIFGLALGTSPGFNLGNHHIPLNLDFLLSATFSNPSSAGLSNAIGTLNTNGQATVALAVPNLPWLSGWTVYGGFIILDAQGQISGISDPIQIDIV